MKIISLLLSATAQVLPVVRGATVEYSLVIDGAYMKLTDANGTDLSRSASLVNGTLPGPTLVATEGDQMIIRVKNKQPSASAEGSLHWHGIYQTGTPFYDGVPGVAMCGICVECETVYNFTASPAGTHWYHSHSGMQYSDGQYGALIVSPKSDADLPKWETEISEDDEIVVLFSEWAEVSPFEEFNELEAGIDLGGTYRNGNGKVMEADVSWPTILANGKDGTEINVNSGTSYRFRLISGASNYVFNVSIASHQMELVMVDPGTYLEPTMVDYVSMEVGARYDVLINSTAAPGRYPIYVTDVIGLNVAKPAVLVVDDGGDEADSGPADSDGIYNTAAFPAPLDNSAYPEEAERQMTITLGGTDTPYTWNLDNIDATLPSVPVYLSGGAFGMEADQVLVKQVGVDEVIDVLLDNSNTMMTHPFHLHGHKFWVLGMANEGEELVQTENPVARDTVNVRSKGKTLIRVKFDNPGPWIFHCHIDFHLVAGMAMVWLVGEPGKDWPLPPTGTALRLCGGDSDFTKMFANPWTRSVIDASSVEAGSSAFSQSLLRGTVVNTK